MHESLADLAPRLALSAQDLNALRRQGVLCAEARRTGTVHKLRFRHGGRQHVRWLGRDSALAAAVQRALDDWQRPRQARLTIARRLRAIRRAQRSLAQRLRPAVQQAGLIMHGLRVRRPRSKKP